MKKIILIFSIATFFSCRNDDTSNHQTEATMVGKWSLQKVDVVKSSNGQTQTTENTDCDKKTIHEFTQSKNISTFYGIINNVCQLYSSIMFHKPNSKTHRKGKSTFADR